MTQTQKETLSNFFYHGSIWQNPNSSHDIWLITQYAPVSDLHISPPSGLRTALPTGSPHPPQTLREKDGYFYIDTLQRPFNLLFSAQQSYSILDIFPESELKKMLSRKPGCSQAEQVQTLAWDDMFSYSFEGEDYKTSLSDYLAAIDARQFAVIPETHTDTDFQCYHVFKAQNADAQEVDVWLLSQYQVSSPEELIDDAVQPIRAPERCQAYQSPRGQIKSIRALLKEALPASSSSSPDRNLKPYWVHQCDKDSLKKLKVILFREELERYRANKKDASMDFWLFQEEIFRRLISRSGRSFAQRIRLLDEALLEFHGGRRLYKYHVEAPDDFSIEDTLIKFSHDKQLPKLLKPNKSAQDIYNQFCATAKNFITDLSRRTFSPKRTLPYFRGSDSETLKFKSFKQLFSEHSSHLFTNFPPSLIGFLQQAALFIETSIQNCLQSAIDADFITIVVETSQGKKIYESIIHDKAKVMNAMRDTLDAELKKVNHTFNTLTQKVTHLAEPVLIPFLSQTRIKTTDRSFYFSLDPAGKVMQTLAEVIQSSQEDPRLSKLQPNTDLTERFICQALLQYQSDLVHLHCQERLQEHNLIQTLTEHLESMSFLWEQSRRDFKDLLLRLSTNQYVYYEVREELSIDSSPQEEGTSPASARIDRIESKSLFPLDALVKKEDLNEIHQLAQNIRATLAQNLTLENKWVYNQLFCIKSSDKQIERVNAFNTAFDKNIGVSAFSQRETRIKEQIGELCSEERNLLRNRQEQADFLDALSACGPL